jgi:N-methylhydantoinase B
MDRVRFRPWGVAGGRHGSQSGTVLRRGGSEARQVGKIDIVELEPGDVVAFTSPSGGGFGDPLRRRVEAVLQDVRRGLVSGEAAARQYGVIVEDGRLDAAKTQTRRADLERGRPTPAPEIDYGPEREAYETAWPDAARLELRRILAGQAASLRPYLRQLICQKLDQQLAARGRVSPEDVRSTWNAICELSETGSATPQGGTDS